jgi:hypothetical protein
MPASIVYLHLTGLAEFQKLVPGELQKNDSALVTEASIRHTIFENKGLVHHCYIKAGVDCLHNEEMEDL